MELIMERLRDTIITGDAQKAKLFAEEALRIGMIPKDILNDGLNSGMRIIGQQFRNQFIGIPDVLMASRAMHAALYVLKPRLEKNNFLKSQKGTILIGTVAGDLHDIGKNIVKMVLTGEGYRIIDLGIDVPPERFIKGVKKYKPQILAMSALLTTTIGEFGKVVQLLRDEGLRSEIGLLVGGTPVTAKFAENIEVDGYAPDAYSALKVVEKLIQNKAGFIFNAPGLIPLTSSRDSF